LLNDNESCLIIFFSWWGHNGLWIILLY
jgi:hypothetical protein